LKTPNDRAAVALRWLAVPFVAAAGFYLTVQGTSLYVDLLVRGCAPRSFIHGVCSDWMVVRSPFYAAAVLAAFFAGVPAALTAPSRRPRTLWVVYGAGVLLSAALFGRAFPGPVAAAALAGAAAAAFLHWKVFRAA
jgi:hypothetical protein